FGFDILRTWKISVGKRIGKKQNAGDKKTPEGLYFVLDKKDSSSLLPVYGKKAFVLNYPNDKDRATGRSGVGIWLHGSEYGKEDEPTSGCIKMRNEDLLALDSFIEIGTPILILQKENLDSLVVKTHLNFSEIKTRKEQIKKLHEDVRFLTHKYVYLWADAWSKKNLNNYMAFYSDEFICIPDSLNITEYQKRKEQIFKSADTIGIKISNVQITDIEPDIAFLNFYQQYLSVTINSNSTKIFHLLKQNGSWKIFREYGIAGYEINI
ncbi:MAG: L,D-transpeptidase family protein, partial [Elusimicrobiota bacterium]